MDTTKVQVPYTAEAGIDIANVTTAKAFTDWLASVDDQKFVVRGVHFQSVDMFGPKVGFIKFKADLVDDKGKFVPGIVFMRGGSVGILTVLTCNGQKYSLMTVQPRIATGRFDFTEIPAGMLDGSGNFAGVAAKELDEEAEIKIAQTDLVDLSAFGGHTKGFFVSPGGTDETLRLFLFEKEVTADELVKLNGKCTGVQGEGEQITLKIMPLDEIWKIADGKTCVAYLLYQKLLQEGEVTQVSSR